MSRWRSSDVDEMVLAAFTEKGPLPSKEEAHWRVQHVTGFVAICEAFVGMDVAEPPKKSGPRASIVVSTDL